MKNLFVLVFLLCSVLSFADSKNPSLPAKVSILEPTSLVNQFNGSDQEEKQFMMNMILAAKAMRQVVFYQTHRHALAMNQLFRTAFSPDNIEKTKSFFTDEQFKELMRYVFFFQDNVGPYDAYKNLKFYLVESDVKTVEAWIKYFQGDSERTKEIARLMADQSFEPNEYPLDGTGLEKTGGNLYEHGLTSEEVQEAVKAGLKLLPNGRVVRDLASRKLKLQLFALADSSLDPEIRKAIEVAIVAVKEAIALSKFENQRKYLESFVEYLATGDVEAAKKMTHFFVAKEKPKVRFYAEFIYFYYDFMGGLAKFDITLMGVSAAQSDAMEEIAKNAQYFENQFPYGKFKKTFPPGFDPGVSMLYGLYRGGPRENPGLHIEDPLDPKISLNIFPFTPEMDSNEDFKKELSQRLAAVMSRSGISNGVQYYWKGVLNLLMLHELLGHGSGTFDPAKYPNGEDPYTAMGPDGTSLEEMRANLAGFFMFLDPMLVQKGMFKNKKQAEAVLNAWLYQYISWLALSAARNEPIVWPHTRAALFLLNYWIDKKVLVLVEQSGQPVFKIKNLSKLINASNKLLKQVQQIRANREEKKLKLIYEKYAPKDVSSIPWVKLFQERAKVLPPESSFLFQPFAFKDCNILLIGDPKKPETLIYGF